MDAVAQENEAREALRRSLSLSIRSKDKDWYRPTLTRAKAIAARMYRDIFGGRIPADTRAAIAEYVEDALRDTKRDPEQRDTQVARLARGLAAYLASAILDSNTPSAEWEKVWRAEHDDKVRPSHAEADGQVVDGDGYFTVGGVKMFAPGDLSAPAEEWANCRCHPEYRRRTAMPLPDQMVAAAEPGEKGGEETPGIVIVGLPVADDPINEVSSEVPPHITVIYMHEDFLEQAAQILAGEAPKYEPTTMEVGEVGELGDGGAQVAHVNPLGLADVRDALMGYEPIQQGMEAVEQFPDWTPHVTLGYPETPPLSTEVPDTITIDRLAILDRSGALHSEYPLGEPMDDTTVTEPDERVDVEEIDDDDEFPSSGAYDLVPLYGVLAPEGAPTGDKRGMLEESLEWTDPPLSLRWMEVDDEGHKGSVVTGRMDRIWREDGLIKWEGVAAMTEKADEMVGLIADRHLRGISVDLDDLVMEMRTKDGSEVSLPEPDENGEISVSDVVFDDLANWTVKGRIRSAAVLPIPAFPESFIAIGTWADHDAQPVLSDEPEVEVEDEPEELVASTFAISEKPWDGSASRFTPEQWYASTIVHRSTDKQNKSDHSLPIREPNGDLSRAGVHAAAGRLSQTDATPEQKAKAKAALRGAYKQLSEDPPEGITAATFAPGTQDGPGWLTHPVDTDRLRDYWVRGRGAAKIAWGLPGDFNRCRAHLAEYIKPQHLAGYCANRHKDALGFWPGEHRGGKHSSDVAAFNLVASGAPTYAPPRSVFEDPQFAEPAPWTITDKDPVFGLRRVFGHAALWDTCHTGFADRCVSPPSSPSDYSHFHLGYVELDDGTHLPTGTLTMGTGHADLSMSATQTLAHYDNTGTAFAQVRCGEDAFGIWFSGVILPTITDEQVFSLRGAKISGDWRNVAGQGLDAIAMLAVNTPGFPIVRTALAASAGERQSLVAAGIVDAEPFNPDALKEIVAAAVTERLSVISAREALRSAAVARRRATMESIAASAAARRGV